MSGNTSSETSLILREAENIYSNIFRDVPTYPDTVFILDHANEMIFIDHIRVVVECANINRLSRVMHVSSYNIIFFHFSN